MLLRCTLSTAASASTFDRAALPCFPSSSSCLPKSVTIVHITGHQPGTKDLRHENRHGANLLQRNLRQVRTWSAGSGLPVQRTCGWVQGTSRMVLAVMVRSLRVTTDSLLVHSCV